MPGPGSTAPGTMQTFFAEFRAEFDRKTLEMIERLPTLPGMSPWILKDFRSPRRQSPDCQLRRTRKAAGTAR